MKRHIVSAELVRYNANNRGKDVGDCVKRAISLAFGESYTTVSKLLNAKMKDLREHQWNISSVFGEVIRDLGGGREIWVKADEYPTIDEFADTHPVGTYILSVGPKFDKHSSHLCTVIDGKLYDSWNSLNYYVKRYWVVKSSNTLIEYDVREDMDRIKTLIKECVQFYLDKYLPKYVWYDPELSDEILIRVPVSGYKYTAVFNVPVSYPQYKYYGIEKISIPYVFSPKTTYEEVEPTVQNVTKIKLYDRLYAADARFKDDIEEIDNRGEYPLFDTFDTVTQRAFKSLPGWARGLTQRFYVDRPGMYSDSYDLTIRKLANDPDPWNDGNTIQFRAYDAAQLKDMLKRYHDKFERPDLDYSVGEEY